ncbi:MAG: TldD/PmbA family protein [Gemmatimonadales bacterium]|nr:MAG: TldD/PmbA family protein [Gemmatimonadales bacterium]
MGSTNEFLSEDEARRITDRVLALSEADHCRANLSSAMDGNTRFAQNQMSTSGDINNTSLTVTSAFGLRVASSTTNRFDDESLAQVVRTSEELARLAPEDSEYMGELGPQSYPDSDSYYPATANLEPEERARAIAEVTEQAVAEDLISTGFLVHRSGASCVATSSGLFAYRLDSRVNFTTTVRTEDGTGSGWAGTSVNDWADLNTRELGGIAVSKAIQSREPRDVEPGRWTVVMEPTAVGNMVNLMVNQLSARAADEGRSFFSAPGGGTKLGEQFIDERVTIHSDPEDPRIHSTPFSGEGLPNRRTTWVENGVLRELNYDRYWAEQNDREPTGFPSGWYMAGGSDTLEQMIASTERGLLLTRFWYIRGVDPRTILFTGLTRDGTFLIENGQITHPVKNLRWNETPIFMLNNIEMMGAPVRISSGESAGLTPAVVVPPLKVRDFAFTSISDAI